MARSVTLKDSPDRRCLVGLCLELDANDDRNTVTVSLRHALDLDSPISKHPAACVQSIEGELLDAAESLFAEIDAVLLVNSAVDCREHHGALRIAVESLSDEADFYTGKFQPFDDAVAISQISAQPACVIDEDHVECPRLCLRGCEKFLQAGALGRRSRDCRVRENAFVEHSKAFTSGILAALPD